jgi:hypothetical protein
MLRVVLSLLITLAAWGWATPSWADKVAPSLTFETDPMTAAVAIYETTPETQADLAKALLKTNRSFYKPIAGFERLALFTSTDGTRIAALTLWQDNASYAAFQASQAAAEDLDYTKYYEKFVKERPGGSASLPTLPDPLVGGLLTVDQTVAPPSMVPITVEENALVQLICLEAPGADQADVLSTMAQNTLQSLPKLYPAPRTAILLRDPDASQLILLANWGYAEEFRDLSQLPALPWSLPQPLQPFVEVTSSEDTLPLPPGQPDGGTDNGMGTSGEGETEGTNPTMVNSDNLEPSGDDRRALFPATNLSQDNHLYQLVKVVAPKVNKYEANQYEKDN